MNILNVLAMIRTRNLILCLCFLSMILGCQDQMHQAKAADEETTNGLYHNTYEDLGYSLSLQVTNDQKAGDFLEAKFRLSDDHYIASSHSEDSTYGHFSMEVLHNDYALLHGPKIEDPPSKVEYDSKIKQEVRLLKGEVSIRQSLKYLQEKKGPLSGEIWFVLEPRCSVEKFRYELREIEGQTKVVALIKEN